MSSEVPSASETVPEISSLTKVERDALVLDFQRLAARLVQAKLLSASTSTRLMRSLNRERLAADARRQKFAQLLLEVLLGLGDGTLTDGQHFVRLDDEHIARAEQIATLCPAMFHARDGARRDPRAVLQTLGGDAGQGRAPHIVARAFPSLARHAQHRAFARSGVANDNRKALAVGDVFEGGFLLAG